MPTSSPNPNQRIVHEYIHIDSADRDLVKYPNVYKFRSTFQAPYNNVIGIELVSADMPKTNYVVVAGVNDKFDYYYNAATGEVFTVTLTAGDYTSTTLATELKTQLEAADATSTSYSASTWTITTSNSHFVFTHSATDFTFLFSTGTSADTTTDVGNRHDQVVTLRGSARTLLGFNIADAASSSSVLTAPNKFDLGGSRYVMIEGVANGQLNLENIETSSASGFNNVFAKIQFGNTSHNTILHFESEIEIRQEFPQPIEKLHYIDWSLKQYGGFDFDSNGINYSMLVRIYRIEQYNP